MPTNTTKDPEKGGEQQPLIINAPEEKISVLEDAWDTLKLGAPIFIAMLSWVGVSFY